MSPGRAPIERGVAFFPFIGLTVEGARVDRDPEIGDGSTRRGEFEFGVLGEITDDGDIRLSGHDYPPFSCEPDDRLGVSWWISVNSMPPTLATRLSTHSCPHRRRPGYYGAGQAAAGRVTLVRMPDSFKPS